VEGRLDCDTDCLGFSQVNLFRLEGIKSSQTKNLLTVKGNWLPWLGGAAHAERCPPTPCQ